MQTMIYSPLFDVKEDDSEWSLIRSSISEVRKPPPQLLKWIGNKQRFASLIAEEFPQKYRKYYEPFLGSGAVLGAMAPVQGVAGDVIKPLIDLWKMLQDDPERMFCFYESTWKRYIENPQEVYVEILDSYNDKPDPLNFLFISRSCYGGVVRFTKQGKMSTPMGPHRPIPPESFKNRMILWRNRVKNTVFVHGSYEETTIDVGDGDIIYCDPPYVDSQAILYGAQQFKLSDLLLKIQKWKEVGAKVALSIDGHKKSGNKIIKIDIPSGLFNRQLLVNGGSSMLKRFQKRDQVMFGEDVHDRLLLSW